MNPSLLELQAILGSLPCEPHSPVGLLHGVQSSLAAGCFLFRFVLLHHCQWLCQHCKDCATRSLWISRAVYASGSKGKSLVVGWGGENLPECHVTKTSLHPKAQGNSWGAAGAMTDNDRERGRSWMEKGLKGSGQKDGARPNIGFCSPQSHQGGVVDSGEHDSGWSNATFAYLIGSQYRWELATPQGESVLWSTQSQVTFIVMFSPFKHKVGSTMNFGLSVHPYACMGKEDIGKPDPHTLMYPFLGPFPTCFIICAVTTVVSGVALRVSLTRLLTIALISPRGNCALSCMLSFRNLVAKQKSSF